MGGSEAGQAAAGEARHQISGVQTEALQQTGVLVGVDLVGQLLVGLGDGLLVAALAEQVERLV